MKKNCLLLLLTGIWLQVAAADSVKSDNALQASDSVLQADSQTNLLMIKKSTLDITTEPSEAFILLNDSVMGQSPLSIENVDTGVHVITIKKKGCYLKKVEIRIDTVGKQKFHFELQQPSSICIITEPTAADLFIDKKPAGKTPYFNKLTKPGIYAISVAMNNYEKIELTHELKSNISDTLKLTLKHTAAYTDSIKAFEDHVKKKQKWLTRSIVGGAFLIFGLVLLSIEAKD